VNLLRCANVLLLGAKLVFCSSQRRKSGRECARVQGGRLRQWWPDVGRADMVAAKATPALRPVRDASLIQRQMPPPVKCDSVRWPAPHVGASRARRRRVNIPPRTRGLVHFLQVKEDVGGLGGPAGEAQRSLREYHVVPRRFLRLLRTALGLLDVHRLKA
jgi:hypothetical protein